MRQNLKTFAQIKIIKEQIKTIKNRIIDKMKVRYSYIVFFVASFIKYGFLTLVMLLLLPYIITVLFHGNLHVEETNSKISGWQKGPVIQVQTMWGMRDLPMEVAVKGIFGSYRYLYFKQKDGQEVEYLQLWNGENEALTEEDWKKIAISVRTSLYAAYLQDGTQIFDGREWNYYTDLQLGHLWENEWMEESQKLEDCVMGTCGQIYGNEGVINQIYLDWEDGESIKNIDTDKQIYLAW